MADEEVIRRKERLIAGELYRYFGRVCPELTQKWEKAILKMPPSVLKELVGRLQILEAVSHQTNQELKAAHLAAVKDPEFIKAAAAARLEVTPIAGLQLQDTVQKVLATPKHLAERAKSIIAE